MIKTSVKKGQNELAYEKLKEAIVTLQLAPGDSIHIAQLMAQYNMGRTPINQAIHRLHDERLVHIIPRKGVIVTPLSLDEAMDLIAVRMVNEKLCITLAAQHITDPQLAALKSVQVRYVKALQERCLAKALEADRKFHEKLAEASGNRILPDVLTRLHACSQRFWALSLNTEGHGGEVIQEHEAIIEALEKRSVEAALSAIETHIASFHHTFLSTLATKYSSTF